MDSFARLHLDLALEGYIVSSKMQSFNFDLWKEGEHNILFITGLSGSGKTTLAEKMEKEYDALLFELDGIDYDYDSTNAGILDELKEKSKVYAKIVQTQTVSSIHQYSYTMEEFISIFNTLISIMRSHHDKRFIVEGIQLMGLYKSFPFNEPTIIVGSSMLKSLYRRGKRTVEAGGRWSVMLKNEFLQLLAFYIDSEKKLSKFRKIIKTHSKT